MIPAGREFRNKTEHKKQREIKRQHYKEGSDYYENSAQIDIKAGIVYILKTVDN